MRNITKNKRLTLAQSFIAQGLINDPIFIKAAEVQAAEITNGNYKLLGSILFDMENENQPQSNFWARIEAEEQEYR